MSILRTVLLAMALLVTSAPYSPATATAETDEALETLFRKSDRPPPTRAPGLDRAAHSVLAHAGDPSLRHHVRHAGVYDGMVLPVVLAQPSGADTREALAGVIRDQVLPHGVTHYGLAENDTHAVILFVRRVFHMGRPLSVLAPGTLTRLEGRLDARYRAPRVVMALPDGRFRTVRALSDGVHISILLPLDAGEGRYVVELLVDGPQGVEVVALTHITLGPDIERPQPSTEPSATKGHDPSERLMGLINSARAAHGLDLIYRDPLLDRTARMHTIEMRELGRVAHVLRAGETPKARLQREGVRARRFYENVAMSRSVQEAHDELMASPSHRQALLDPQVSRIGLGVLKGPGGAWYVTEHLVVKPRR